MKFQFRPHIVDTDLPEGNYAQTAVGDLDGDGRPEFVLGQQYGDLFVYKMHTVDHWTRHLIGHDSPSDVAACILDVDGDGKPDIVTGGAWYRNTGDLTKPFERVVFDPDLRGVHDILVADINGDGRPEILTMADKNNVRWYGIPPSPRNRWERHDIGPAVHSGMAVGDLDGDGDLDIVRTDIWFENVRGDGTEWTIHEIGKNTPPPPDYQKPWSYDATRCVIHDLDKDGKNDVLFVDCEIPGGKAWWMENVNGKGTEWRRHEIPNGDPRRRGAYHTLIARDFDGDGDLDFVSCEMEGVPGDGPPRWYLWENVDGRGGQWREHVIFDGGLGGHESVAGDFTGNGKLDLITKPWNPRKDNAVGGRRFVLFLENISE